MFKGIPTNKSINVNTLITREVLKEITILRLRAKHSRKIIIP